MTISTNGQAFISGMMDLSMLLSEEGKKVGIHADQSLGLYREINKTVQRVIPLLGEDRNVDLVNRAGEMYAIELTKLNIVAHKADNLPEQESVDVWLRIGRLFNRMLDFVYNELESAQVRRSIMEDLDNIEASLNEKDS